MINRRFQNRVHQTRDCLRRQFPRHNQINRRTKRNAPHQFGDIIAAHRYFVGLHACDGGIPYCLFVGFTHETFSFHFSKNLHDRIWQFTKGIDYRAAGFAQSFYFPGMRAAAALDDGAGMAETSAFARSLAANVSDHRLGDFSSGNQLRQFLLL